MKCWGENFFGKLGNGTRDDSTIPVDVVGLTSGVQGIAAGEFHTCALTTAGGVKCWGYNYYGQLGNGTNDSSNTPVDVPGLSSGVQAIAVGDYHTCALTTGGGVKCWGDNSSGQLGDGTFAKSNTPVDVSDLSSGVQAITAGINHTCALNASGGVQCWGSNYRNQLGDGTSNTGSVPVDVSGLTSGVRAVAAGDYHTCALMTLGGVKCWGLNEAGQLGNGTVANRNTPVNVNNLTGVQAITAGGAHTCALTGNGGIRCWGSNSYGQLGNRIMGHRTRPIYVFGLMFGMQSLSLGGYHTCAMSGSGGVQCWGANRKGQLGDGTTTDRATPLSVAGLSTGVQAVAAGGSHTCTVGSSGGVQCWGDNFYGQLGNGTKTPSTTPVNVSGLGSGVQTIAAGANHTCALMTSGGVKCWGSNEFGQLGDGTENSSSSTPVDVSGLSSGVQAITASDYHTCALMTSGGVKCWGGNWFGQLGDGTRDNGNTPVNVSGLSSGVQAITTGSNHTCALMVTGGVKCWGNNYFGQMGDGTGEDSNIPVNVYGLSSNVQAIAAGANHTCALMTSSGVKCWGFNLVGQLGDGTTINRLSPVDVPDLTSGMQAIDAGDYHTCAMMTAGGIQCWGNNSNGQLGDGLLGYYTTPVDVIGYGQP